MCARVCVCVCVCVCKRERQERERERERESGVCVCVCVLSDRVCIFSLAAHCYLQEELVLQSRLDALVCSLGNNPMLREKLRVVRDLRAAGIRTDLIHDTTKVCCGWGGVGCLVVGLVCPTLLSGRGTGRTCCTKAKVCTDVGGRGTWAGWVGVGPGLLHLTSRCM